MRAAVTEIRLAWAQTLRELDELRAPSGVRAVPASGHDAVSLLGVVSWDTAHLVLAICSEGSFARAAQLRRIPRQTASQRVRSLEQHLGTELFTRAATGLTATTTGALIISVLRRAIASWERAYDQIHRPITSTSEQSATALPSPIRLAGFSLAIPMLIEAMTVRLPEAQFATIPFDPAASMNELRDDAIDLVFGYAPPGSHVPRLPGVTTQPILDEPIWLAVSDSGPHKDADELDLRDLAEERWVVRPDGPLRRLLVDSCEAAGFSPRIEHAVSDNTAVRALISTGRAVTLSAPGVPLGAGLTVIPLRNGPHRTCFAAWKPDRIPHRYIPALLDGLCHWYFLTAQQNSRYWTFLIDNPGTLSDTQGHQVLHELAHPHTTDHHSGPGHR
ncbi:LysR family transcriptional regulator [Lentzea sp. HUAS12]|nr:LysR family transcriptional regulator [Lentzea sp. HUAS12]